VLVNETRGGEGGAGGDLLAAACLKIVNRNLEAPANGHGEGDRIEIKRIPGRFGAVSTDIGGDPLGSLFVNVLSEPLSATIING